MSKEPVFVTGISIGRGPGFIVAALNAPTGDFIAGAIESAEVMRIAMSLTTLKSVTDLLVKTCHELEVASRASERITVSDVGGGLKTVLNDDGGAAVMVAGAVRKASH